MSTETPAAAPEPTPALAPKPAPPAATETAPPAAPAQEPIDWTAEARKWEARAKENKTAADELAALKAAQMTEAEKAAARTAELEAKVKGYETREQIAGWKAEVATATGIPAAALAGSTLEEIQAHAETLRALIPAPPRGPVVPAEGTTTGTAKVAQLAQVDLKAMTPEQIVAAKAEGRLNDLLGITS